MALEIVDALPADNRPAIIAATLAKTLPVPEPFPGQPACPLTMMAVDNPWTFDREVKFGYREQLDYQVVINWSIAAHKSQGTMHHLMNTFRYELFYPYTMNDDRQMKKLNDFFSALAPLQFPEKLEFPNEVPR